MLTLMAISQYDAGLIKTSLAASAITACAVVLRRESPITYQRIVCVSRSVFTACTRQNPSGAPRRQPRWTASPYPARDQDAVGSPAVPPRSGPREAPFL